MPVLFKGASGPVSSLVNYYSSGGVASSISVAPSNTATAAREVLSGALTSGTLATVVTHTGRGRLNFLSAYSKNGTSRTIRCKVTIDGVVVFDATTSAVVGTGLGQIAVGYMQQSSSPTVEFQPIDYQESLLIEVASSLTETDNVAVAVNRETWAS